MIVAAFSILIGLYFFRQRNFPFDALIKLVQAEWVGGISFDYDIDLGPKAPGPLLWMQSQLRSARRAAPLSHDSSSLLIERFFLFQQVLKDLNRVRTILLTRLATTVCAVIVLRMLRTPHDAMLLYDVMLQCGTAFFLALLIWTISQELERTGVFNQPFNAECKLWIEGVLFDQHPHTEFQSLLYSERSIGISLRAERIKWLRMRVAEGGISDLVNQSRLQLTMMLYDLLVLGGVLIGGCLFPLLTLI